MTLRRTLVAAALVSLVFGCDSDDAKTPSKAKTPEAQRTDREKLEPSTLPGVEGLRAEVAEEIDDALAEKLEADREIRTRHKLEDGRPKYTNRLVLESSPYLQQHAHNPVNWYPWGEEAFETARRLDRPILLSVGYSTCHWCHVMEEESFEDVEIARYLNEHYVPIKVDREERPDIDSIYMTAVRMMSGRGGWPMTVWLTPERTPFFGGTYYPPRTGARGGRTGFLELLKRHHERYEEDPAGVVTEAQALATRVARNFQAERGGELKDLERPLRAAAAVYERSYDEAGHGWGRQKFPHPSRLMFLLRYWRRSGSPKALEMTNETLTAMARGGIYDHLAGGFHRYTVDSAWQIPHFEKMLYDNAQLIRLYTEAWQATESALYATVVEESVTYLLRDMRDPGGAFYAATDADSEGEEGTFFVWTPEEIDAALDDPTDTGVVKQHFGITRRGNFEGKNVLSVVAPIGTSAKKLGLPVAEFSERIEAAKEALRKAREERVHPHRDEKILTAWNGLAIGALARAGFVFERDEWVVAAAEAADFVLRELRADDGSLLRSRTRDRRGSAAFAEDYAFTIAGLVTLFEVTGERKWLDAAKQLQEILDAKHWDSEDGGYYRTASGQGRNLLAREKPIRDGAVPSANSVAALNLLRLHALTLDERHSTRAGEVVDAFAHDLRRGSPSVPRMLLAVDWMSDESKEVAIVHRGEADPMLEVVRHNFLPNQVIVSAAETELSAMKDVVPWVERKVAKEGRATAYVCRDHVCKLPTTEPTKFEELASELDPI